MKLKRIERLYKKLEQSVNELKAMYELASRHSYGPIPNREFNNIKRKINYNERLIHKINRLIQKCKPR